MEYVHRDNFRHLTGLGREHAAYINYVLGSLRIDVDQDGALPPGNLIILKNAKGEFCSDLNPLGEGGKHHEVVDYGGYKTNSRMMLSIITGRDGVREVISLPLLMIVAGALDLSGTYQIYQHDFVEDQMGEPIKNACYIGITKRGWRTRWAEHIRAARSGSHYRFHQAIRQWNGVARIAIHTIVGHGHSEESAMVVEEHMVERETLYPLGLNMVPGGRAGLAYLRKIGAIGARERVAPDDRQAVINRFFERASRRGLPNPLAAANWLNPNYAEKVICAGPDRLKAQQVRDARFFSSLGQDADAITERVGARNVDQVRRVLSGSTYSRIL